MVSPTTSEVGVPRAQGRARIRPSGLRRVLQRHARHARPTRIGAESAWTGGVVYRLMVDM